MDAELYNAWIDNSTNARDWMRTLFQAMKEWAEDYERKENQ